MIKTIQLLPVDPDDASRVNLILSGGTIQLDGKRYCLSEHDLIRLNMFTDDNLARIDQRKRGAK